MAVLSSENTVYLWDYLTSYLLMNFVVPQILTEPSFSTAISTYYDYILIGFADGSSLISKLSLDSETMQLNWNPIKVINIR